MGNLIEIQSQIEKLQKQATEIKSREFGKTVTQILAMMEAFGITLKDLQQGAGKLRKTRGKAKSVPRRSPLAKPATKKAAAKKGVAKKAARKSSNQKGVKVAAKYRGPNGESWSGRGLMPRWLAAQVAAGKSKESFAVKG